MSNQEILEKAINLAMAKGWKQRWDGETLDSMCKGYQPYERLIFNHDFAKSLWIPGDETLEGYTSEDNPLWQVHLQMMVIADDPIKYLGEHLDD